MKAERPRAAARQPPSLFYCALHFHSQQYYGIFETCTWSGWCYYFEIAFGARALLFWTAWRFNSEIRQWKLFESSASVPLNSTQSTLAPFAWILIDCNFGSLVFSCSDLASQACTKNYLEKQSNSELSMLWCKRSIWAAPLLPMSVWIIINISSKAAPGSPGTYYLKYLAVISVLPAIPAQQFSIVRMWLCWIWSVGCQCSLCWSLSQAQACVFESGRTSQKVRPGATFPHWGFWEAWSRDAGMQLRTRYWRCHHLPAWQ